ncbi:hypothetical protein AB4P95_26250 [Pseudomonas sp. A1437]|uniref:hypothetical protein n=1 Tax=unclassified Pseudomonas TaxID=196821 RepID=UPI003783809E
MSSIDSALPITGFWCSANRSRGSSGHYVLRKKVITTNKSVVDYDFYNPANILVIDENSPVIPEHFITAPYVDIPAPIYEKYTLQGWVKTVFSQQ